MRRQRRTSRTAARKPKGETRAFVEEFLASHPGSSGPDIVRGGETRRFTRSSTYRAIHTLIAKGTIRRARGRHWLGRIEDPELAVAAETERVLAILDSKRYSPSAKVQAAQQLARESRVGTPVSLPILDLLLRLPRLPLEVRVELVPFVQRAVRAVVRATSTPESQPGKHTRPARAIDIGFARRVWDASKATIDEFLLDSGGLGTMAWNTVYEAVDPPGLVSDEERVDFARRAIAVELLTPLPEPSAARAVLRRIAAEDRLRDRVRDELLRIRARKGVKGERLRRLMRDVDIAPPSVAGSPRRF